MAARLLSLYLAAVTVPALEQMVDITDCGGRPYTIIEPSWGPNARWTNPGLEIVRRPLKAAKASEIIPNLAPTSGPATMVSYTDGVSQHWLRIPFLAPTMRDCPCLRKQDR
ncbi:unnamed protein product [Dibothriocephalus latus]|uniref:Uncharacterized protein n=1 Tax=Dibothriocephalus latus TaxID=60516 RepID=A0A3P7LZY1_DIBLA|nr:unnamed protein product [Dibothriocephalus latus]